MILHALYDYYQSHIDELPLFGTELKEMGFIIVIDREGRFVRIEDQRKAGGKSANQFLVKKSIGRSGTTPRPNHLYDNAEYALGLNKDCTDIEQLPETNRKYEAFADNVHKLTIDCPDETDLLILDRFLSRDRKENLEKMQMDPLWPNVLKSLTKKYGVFSFRIDGDRQILAEKQNLIRCGVSDESTAGSNEFSVCLVTGSQCQPITTSTATMIPGGKSNGKLVTFQVNSGYDSYGKKQGENAPVCESAEFAYSTALIHLLRRDSPNKFTIGDRTFVFWATGNNEVDQEMEAAFADLFSFEPTNETADNPHKISNVFRAVSSGMRPTADTQRFRILGMAPNSARIAVNFWEDISVRDFASNIISHFNDFEVVDTRKQPKPYAGLRNILSSVTRDGKASEAIPNLAPAVARSIFKGLHYPETLFTACLRRIRAEYNVTTGRAAIIKGYLARLNDNQTKPTIMLDTANTNTAYLCGRLFAVIERLQNAANGITTVRERYLNSASSTPAVVFPTLLNLSNHHSDKLDGGLAHYYDCLKSEIFNGLPADGFPSQLSLPDQGRFFIGYYHQMQDLFTSKKNKTDDK